MGCELDFATAKCWTENSRKHVSKNIFLTLAPQHLPPTCKWCETTLLLLPVIMFWQLELQWPKLTNCHALLQFVAKIGLSPSYQWPFQEPKLEVPTIYKAHVRPCKAYVREYPHKIWPYMVQYLHFRILGFPSIHSSLKGELFILKNQLKPILIKKTENHVNPLPDTDTIVLWGNLKFCGARYPCRSGMVNRRRDFSSR